MKDEIKEILDKLNNSAEHYILYDYEVKQLLDYITNLQEENKSLHTRIKTIKRRRKEQTAKIRKYRDEITNKQNSNKDYKQRIDEAIEYLKKNSEKVELNFVGFPDSIVNFKGSVSTLLKILQGKSDK